MKKVLKITKAVLTNNKTKLALATLGGVVLAKFGVDSAVLSGLLDVAAVIVAVL